MPCFIHACQSASLGILFEAFEGFKQSLRPTMFGMVRTGNGTCLEACEWRLVWEYFESTLDDRKITSIGRHLRLCQEWSSCGIEKCGGPPTVTCSLALKWSVWWNWRNQGTAKHWTITFHGILVVRDWTDYIKLSSITSGIKMSPQVTASRSLGLGTLALQRSRGRALWAVCSRQGLHNSCEVMWQSTVFGTDASYNYNQLYVFIITFSAYIILDESFYILCLPCTNRFFLLSRVWRSMASMRIAN